MDSARQKLDYGTPQFSAACCENWKFCIVLKFLTSVGLLEVLIEDVSPTAPEAAKFNEKDGKASNWIIAFIHDSWERNFERDLDKSSKNVREEICGIPNANPKAVGEAEHDWSIDTIDYIDSRRHG